MNRTQKIVVGVLSAVLAIVAPLGLSHLGSNGPETEIRYPLNAEEQRADFDASGTFDLRLPLIGDVRINATVADWFDPDARPYAFPDLPVTGHVEGFLDSKAILLLSNVGVYGTVEIPLGTIPIRFDHTAIRTDEGEWEARASIHPSSVRAVGAGSLERLRDALMQQTETLQAPR